MLRKQAFRVLELRIRLSYFKRGSTLVQFWKTHKKDFRNNIQSLQIFA